MLYEVITERQVIAVLPANQRVLLQVATVAEVVPATLPVAEHPADVREPESAAGGVRIGIVPVDELVMSYNFV